MLVLLVFVVFVAVRMLMRRKGRNRKHGYQGARDALGKPHGEGKLIARNGDVYEGTFEHGVFRGQGKYVFQAGGWYEGAFENGLFEGDGVEVYANGAHYTGQFRQGVRHGQGEMVYETGSSYKGAWKHGKKDGEGVFYIAGSQGQGSKGVYTGAFRAGMRHGQGTMKYLDRKEVGEFRDGKAFNVVITEKQTPAKELEAKPVIPEKIRSRWKEQ